MCAHRCLDKVNLASVFQENSMKARWRWGKQFLWGQQKPLLWAMHEWWDPQTRTEAVGMGSGDGRSRASWRWRAEAPCLSSFWLNLAEVCPATSWIQAQLRHLCCSWVPPLGLELGWQHGDCYPWLSSELYTCLKWGVFSWTTCEEN